MADQAIEFRTEATNGISLRLAAAGTGPLVVLLHGFPESWYSWRHQLPALAEAGYRGVAPDMRGYGGSDKPDAITAYDQVTIAADVAGLIDRLGYDRAVVVGHDWGAATAWTSALLYPDKVQAVAALSVPYRPRGAAAPLATLRKIFEGRFFYMLYFQTPGVAEAELEADLPRFLSTFLWRASGEAPADAFLRDKPPDAALLDGLDPPTRLPDWLSEADLAHYVGEFEIGGLRGPLNWYRNLDRTWQRMADYQGAKIAQPALFVAGDKDPVIYFTPDGLDVMRQHLPNLHDLVLLPGCGHWTQQERADPVNRALIDFLKAL